MKRIRKSLERIITKTLIKSEEVGRILNLHTGEKYNKKSGM